jgi:nicotinamidase/pyrazinamidase
MKTKKALLVIDMQKEGIVIPYPSSSKIHDHKQLVSNIKRLIRSFTDTDNLVIQTKVWITDPKKTTMTKVYPSEGIAGTPGAEIVDELKKEHFSYVVKKTNYSGFWNTNLDAILKKHKVKEVYLTGINTGFCVFCTGLDAFYRGYDTFLIQDATTTVMGRRAHRKDLRLFTWFCGKKVVSTNMLLKRL